VIHLLGATVPVPYPSWLNPADNTWQITAATLVGLMSIPGLAVLYASIVPKKWAVNVLSMMFAGFSLVLIVWVLWGFKMGFGATSIGGGVRNGVQTQLTGATGTWQHFFENFVGKPGQILNSYSEQGQAVSAANTVIPFHFPVASLAYFQFVFAAITPLLFLGSVLGRIKFTAWCILVPLWSTFVYSVATSPSKEHWTSQVVTSSTCRRACRDSSPPGSWAPDCCEIGSMPCPTTW